MVLSSLSVSPDRSRKCENDLQTRPGEVGKIQYESDESDLGNIYISSALLLHLTVAHLVKREEDEPLCIGLNIGLASTESRPDLDALGRVLDAQCSNCCERLQLEPFICCRCIKETAACNNDFGRC